MAEQLGKYTVIRRLGVGGMAEVFLCKLVGIGGFQKYVVLKKIRADIETDTEFVTMFFDEARLAANLNHPNIISVFEVDQLGGSPYIAMEYVRGATLSTALQKVRAQKGSVGWGELAFIFAGVCAGLDHAHNAEDAAGRALKIVHRDISPQNVMVSSDGVPKIFDFGVAKARGSLALTGADRVKGKFAYMAPEQLRAEPVDEKADVYAVGVCMYEAATGKRPFTGGTDLELFAARLEGKFKMPSELLPDIPIELEHIILSAMAANPADRPDAVELQGQLSAFCGVGGKYSSSAIGVSAWLKGVLGEDIEAYESYSSGSPSMTPMPRSTNLPATNAVEAKRSKGGVNGVIALLSLAAIGLAVALVMIVLKKQEQPETASVANTGTAPISPQPDHDEAIRAFLDQAQEDINEKKFGIAIELLDKATGLETYDAALSVRRTELRHHLDIERTRMFAHDAVAARDWPRARELVNQLLADAPADEDAKQLLADIEREQQVAAATPASPNEVTLKKDPKKKNAPVATIAKAGSGSAVPSTPTIAKAGGGSSTPAGSGSSTSAGSAQVATTVTTKVGSGSSTTGSGSAQVATQVTSPTTTQTKPAITTPVSPTNPGSLDAVPAFSKVTVDGSLTTTEVQTALARTVDTLRGCYRTAAQKAKQTPELSVRVSFEIDEGARASGVRVSGDTLGLGGCVKDAIGGVRTRVAPDVGTVSVTAVVRFKPTR